MSRPFFTRSERRALLRFVEKFSGIALFALSLALLFALLSYDPRDPGAYSATWEGPSNWLGWPGAFVADVLVRTLGVASFAIGLYCLWTATRLISGVRSAGALRFFAAPFAAIALATFASSHAAAAPAGGGLGGIIGDFLFGVIAVGLPVYTEQLRMIVATLISAAAAIALTLYTLGGTYAGVRRKLRYARDEAISSFLEIGDMTVDLIHGRRGGPALAPAFAIGQIGPMWRSLWASPEPREARRDPPPPLSEPSPAPDMSALRRALTPRTTRVEPRREPPLAAPPMAPRDDDEIRPFDHTDESPMLAEDPVAEALAAARQAIVRGEPLAPIPRKTPKPATPKPALSAVEIDREEPAVASEIEIEAQTGDEVEDKAENKPEGDAETKTEMAPPTPVASTVAPTAAVVPAVEASADSASETRDDASSSPEPEPETASVAPAPVVAQMSAPDPVSEQTTIASEPAPVPTLDPQETPEPTPNLTPTSAPATTSEDDDWDEAARAAIESPGAVILNARARLNADATPLPIQAAQDAVLEEPTTEPLQDGAIDRSTEVSIDAAAETALCAAPPPDHVRPPEPTASADLAKADLTEVDVTEADLAEVDLDPAAHDAPPSSAAEPATDGDALEAPLPATQASAPAIEPAPAPQPEPKREPEPEPVPYELPSIELLARPREEDQIRMTEEMLARRIDQLQGVLHDYGVRGNIIDAHPGPVVTLFELEPARGTKASRVIGLADDIARSMSAVSARVSTVPGRNIIGIELPNQRRETVLLRELLSHPAYVASDGALPLALGKNIAGGPVVANLARMPHLLIAGTTGSGKSVGINTMLMSLLYRLSPQEVKLLLIDPKMLELNVYNDIPHLIAPVVTDPKKAVLALKWAVREMEARYEKMARLNVRGLESYNEKVAEARAKGENFERVVQIGFDDATGEPIYETQTFEPEPMPMIVIVVDEMADLMMVAGKEIEHCIQRLAQMARASGIHLIMATQRPSVDVITGTIKANFPIRISFQVTSKIDSRTILGEMGAEQLLGRGDMLYNAGGARLARVHGAFVSDGEVAAVTDHLRTLGSAEYRVDFDQIEGEAGVEDAATTGSGGDDALYDRAVSVVAQERKASTSFIQRRLQIGYNRAARIVEMMEQQGVVSPANHVGKREVLIGQTEGQYA